VAVSAGL